MQTARVYKINIKENILRQVVFTDRNLFLGFVAGLALLVWKFGEMWPSEFKVLLTIFASGLALLIFTVKIDRQSFLKVLVRLLPYLIREKKLRN